MSRSEILEKIIEMPKVEQIEFIQELMKTINSGSSAITSNSKKKSISHMAGILSEEEYVIWKEAIDECRKIDYDGW